MPLRKGSSQSTISRNIRQLIHEGYPCHQAIGYAYSFAGMSVRGHSERSSVKSSPKKEKFKFKSGGF